MSINAQEMGNVLPDIKRQLQAGVMFRDIAHALKKSGDYSWYFVVRAIVIARKELDAEEQTAKMCGCPIRLVGTRAA